MQMNTGFDGMMIDQLLAPAEEKEKEEEDEFYKNRISSKTITKYDRKLVGTNI